MAEIDFFITSDEEIELIEFILNEGTYLIPDCKFKPELIEIRDIKTYLKYRMDGSGLFFIISPVYFSSPLEIKSVYNEHYGRIIYYIEQRSGGPTIEFCNSQIYEKAGVNYLSSSCLGHYPTYWNTKTFATEKAPVALKALYAKIIREIKKSNQLKTTKRTYWLSKGITSMRRDGLKLNGIDS